jgi:hypothetical protein
MVGMLKFAGALSKDARKAMDPVPSRVAVQRNRMARKLPDSATIIDVDKETITTVNYLKKTYSVMTFAEMKETMERAAEKMKEQKSNAAGQSPDMQFDVKVNDTGQSKIINGNNTHEVIVTVSMRGTDAKSGAKGGIDMTSDMWLAPEVAGYAEVREFYRRMGEKLDWSPGMNPMMASRPVMARAMGQLYKQGSKLDGMPVFQSVKMAGAGENASGSQPQPATERSNQQSNQPSSAPPTSVSQAIGSALGGRFGGFGRRKKQNQDTATSTNSPGDSSSASNSGSLLEVTSEVTSYSTGHADPSLFEIPAGFSQVQDPRAAQH